MKRVPAVVGSYTSTPLISTTRLPSFCGSILTSGSEPTNLTKS